MNVVQLSRPDPATGWRQHELQALLGLYALHARSRTSGGWDTGTTEFSQPQFYVLGTEPDADCVLCISRLGRLYVLEDGSGRCLMESDSLPAIIEYARERVPGSRLSSVATRLGVALFALRVTWDDKIQPVLAAFA